MNPSRLQFEKLKQFKKYVLRWNSTHNLVSKSQETNLDEHINDSLSIEACLGKNLIDLGAGGGFPGIPIAIVSPNKRIFLIENYIFLLLLKNLIFEILQLMGKPKKFGSHLEFLF